MSTNAARILEDAMKLSDAERADLVACLLASLEPKTQERFDELWGPEIERRIHAIDSGSATLIPWEEARKRIFGVLRQKL